MSSFPNPGLSAEPPASAPAAATDDGPARDVAVSKTGSTRAAGIVGLAVMCSRVLGLAREQIFAALFGAGTANDAFIAAFRAPNLLRDLFAEGALSTAFITTFSKKIQLEGDGAAWRLANKMGTLLLVFMGAMTLLGIALSPQLIAVLGHGFHAIPGKFELTVVADADHVSVHPAGVARRAGDGDAQRQERVRRARDGVEFLQPRLHRRGAGDGVAAESALRTG